ncbi:MAG TPA: type IV pilus modification protein PilV [Gammaproteobacteria bacterium]|nr:type IV pilus modification protein PilV [Gammaproteobacteria bacterium]
MIMSLQRKRLAGFTLIEILIALVIFSIGLLGLAGMQLRGAEGTNTAYFRSQATLLANDMAERIHANRQGVMVSAYADLNTNGFCTEANRPDPFCASRDGAPADDCTPAEMATFDLYTLACNIEERLPPGGYMTVECSDPGGAGCSAGSPHTVSVFWNEVGDDGTAATRSVTLAILP